MNNQAFIKAAYKKFPDNLINEVIEYYSNYKRGILDTMEKYPSIVPPKVKKILAKYHTIEDNKA